MTISFRVSFGDRMISLMIKNHARAKRQLITQTVECLEQKRYFLQNYVVLLYVNLAHKFDFYLQPDDLLHILKGPGDSCH